MCGGWGAGQATRFEQPAQIKWTGLNVQIKKKKWTGSWSSGYRASPSIESNVDGHHWLHWHLARGRLKYIPMVLRYSRVIIPSTMYRYWWRRVNYLTPRVCYGCAENYRPHHKYKYRVSHVCARCRPISKTTPRLRLSKGKLQGSSLKIV